jgi:hypothetical protein
MSEVTTGRDRLPDTSPLRTPRAAALAGIVFGVLAIASLVLLRLATPPDPGTAGAWLSSAGRRAAITTALNFIPFAGIAFLWFVGVIRDKIGRHEDRFFATVFLGSGLLFVGMLFVGAAVAGGVIADAGSRHSDASSLDLGRNVTSVLINIYAIRMAAVFTLTTVTIARRTRIVSRWLTLAGLAVALVLLIGTGISVWVEILFPAWILALSLDILVVGARKPITPPG